MQRALWFSIREGSRIWRSDRIHLYRVSRRSREVDHELTGRIVIHGCKDARGMLRATSFAIPPRVVQRIQVMDGLSLLVARVARGMVQLDGLLSLLASPIGYNWCRRVRCR